MFSGKESEWTWNTSSGLSVSYGLVGGTGAQFVLNDPRGGTASFNYITVGVDASVGAKWSFGGSSTAMYSKGKGFIADSFPGNEFHNRDFEGFCLVADASASVIAGRFGGHDAARHSCRRCSEEHFDGFWRRVADYRDGNQGPLAS